MSSPSVVTHSQWTRPILLLSLAVLGGGAGAVSPVTRAQAADAPVIGDADLDGSFDRADLGVVSKALREDAILASDARSRADVASPCDGELDRRDVRLLRRALRHGRRLRERPVVSECHNLPIGIPIPVSPALCPAGPCIDLDDDDGGIGGGGGVAVVSFRPDAMIQLQIPCGLVQGYLPSINQKPGVRGRCDDDALRIGMWPPTLLSGTVAQREAALLELTPVSGNETAGLFINGAAILREIGKQWSSLPKRYDTDGVADPSGSIKVDGWGWSMNKWSWHPFPHGLLAVHGDVLGWDIEWTAKIWDMLGIDGDGGLTCSTSEPSIDLDTWLEPIIELIFGTGGIDLIDRGPACMAIDQVNAATSQLLLDEGYRLALDYERLVHSQNNIIAGGQWALEERAPAITSFTAYPSSIKVMPQQTTFSATLTAHLRDLRPPLTKIWSRRAYVQGNWGSWVTVTPSNPVEQSPGEVGAYVRGTVSWPRPVLAATPTSVQVHLKVIDADGLVATASRSIQVQKLTESGTSLPCETKPYLPQCNP